MDALTVTKPITTNDLECELARCRAIYQIAHNQFLDFWESGEFRPDLLDDIEMSLKEIDHCKNTMLASGYIDFPLYGYYRRKPYFYTQGVHV